MVKPPKTLICEECHQPFKQTFRQGRPPSYCSLRCRRMATLRREVANDPLTRTCPRCSKEFELRAPAQKYCSEECRYGCEFCGERIAPPKPGQLRRDQYCTVECMVAWYDKFDIPAPLCLGCGQDWDLQRFIDHVQMQGFGIRRPSDFHAKCWEVRRFSRFFNPGIPDDEIDWAYWRDIWWRTLEEQETLYTYKQYFEEYRPERLKRFEKVSRDEEMAKRRQEHQQRVQEAGF